MIRSKWTGMTITLVFFPEFSISFLRDFISFSSFSNFEESFLSNFLPSQKETPTIQHEKVRGRKTLLIKIVGIRHCPETNTQTQDTGICLETECFSHGQLYVALSRSFCNKTIYVYAPGGLTINIVHQSVL